MRVGVVVLAAVPAGKHAHQRRPPRRHIDDAFASSEETLCKVLADTVAALDRPCPRLPTPAEPAELAEAVSGVRELCPNLDLAVIVDDHDCVHPLVRIDTDEHTHDCSPQ